MILLQGRPQQSQVIRAGVTDPTKKIVLLSDSLQIIWAL